MKELDKLENNLPKLEKIISENHSHLESTLFNESNSILFDSTPLGMTLMALFIVIGMVYFNLGRKSGKNVLLLTAVALFAFPFFVSETRYILLFGTLISIAPNIARYFKVDF